MLLSQLDEIVSSCNLRQTLPASKTEREIAKFEPKSLQQAPRSVTSRFFVTHISIPFTKWHAKYAEIITFPIRRAQKNDASKLSVNVLFREPRVK